MKGLTPIIGTIMLLLVVVGVAGTMLMWSQTSIESVSEASENETVGGIKKLESSFYINDIYPSQNKIEIKNSGENPLSSDDFAVFLNNTKSDITTHNCGSELQSGQKCNLTAKNNIDNHLIKVIGEYGTWDEFFVS